MRDTNQDVARALAATSTAARPYYEDLNQACDAILRCHECRRLVTHATIVANKGTTPCCGTRKVREIRTLTFWEWLKIRLGILDFPYRQQFLKEFARGAR